LDELLAGYRQGMDEPLPFYPGTSWAYAESYLRHGDPLAAYRAAHSKWVGNEWHPGDQDKPYQRLLFAGQMPLDERFVRLSLTVYAPLIEHMEIE
jgi:exodeoxyribonuclease V gamma subunit